MKNSSEGNDLIGTLLSLTPALVQIFAFFAVDFSNKLQFDKFLLFPSLLIFMNFVVLLLSLACIAIYSYWKQNNISILKGYGLANDGGIIDPKILPNVQKASFILQIILVSIIFLSVIIFICIIIAKQAIHSSAIPFWGIIQWFVYLLFLTCLALEIYIWVEDMNVKKNFSQNQSLFLSRVLDKLFETGWITSPNTLFVSPLQGASPRQIVIKYEKEGATKYLDIRTSFDGKDVIAVKEYNDNPLDTLQSNS